MAANMYRVGDYVFFETSSTTPYQIRRIEELNKTPNGNVEAKVMCFFRRRDISSALILLADKHQSALEEEHDGRQKEDLNEKDRHQLKHRELFLSRQVETLPATHIRGKCAVTLLNETESLLSYLNKDDAFFYSLVYDPHQKTLLADKGEIRVGSRFQADPTARLPDVEMDTRNLSEMEELVWNPDTPLTDKQIDQFMVIASHFMQYQPFFQPFSEDPVTLNWMEHIPTHSKCIAWRLIPIYIYMTKSVGTFARALDCTSTVRQPSLHMSAAAASRDITLYHAMDALHKHNYDVSKAITSLVPSSGPVLCRDEMEEWSASEANLFEEALDKYGKDFTDIRQDFLPWKSLKSIIEYYYMWKTTDRYVQQKRIKAAEAESKLKQVYIPNYNKPNPAQITGKMNGADGTPGRACESCYLSHSNQWYTWGPIHMQCRLCASCWSYWKKYGGLKMPTRLDSLFQSAEEQDGERPAPNQRTERLAQLAATMRSHRCTITGCGKEFRLKTHLARHLATAHGLAIRAGSPRPVMKTRAAFCLITTPLTRISRQICKDILLIRRAARQPIQPINIALIKQECQTRLPEVIKEIKELKPHERGTLDDVVTTLGLDNVKMPLPDILARTEGTKKEPTRLAFPLTAACKLALKPVFTERSESSSPPPTVSPSQPSIMKKRGYEQTNGLDGPERGVIADDSIGNLRLTSRPTGPPAKRPAIIRQAGNIKQAMPTQIRTSVINHLNGGTTRVSGRVKRHGLSWLDAPDDVYFVATDATRKLRKQLVQMEFKRAARKPWIKLNVKVPTKTPATPGGGGQESIVILD